MKKSTILITLILSIFVSIALSSYSPPPPPPPSIDNIPIPRIPDKLTQVGASELTDYRWIHVASEFWWVLGLPDNYSIALSAGHLPIFDETYYPYILVKFPYAGRNQVTTHTRYPSDYPLKVRWCFYGAYGDTCCHEFEPLPRHDVRQSITVPSCLINNQPFWWAAIQTLAKPDAPELNWLYVNAFTITVDIPSCEEIPNCRPRVWVPLIKKK